MYIAVLHSTMLFNLRDLSLPQNADAERKDKDQRLSRGRTPGRSKFYCSTNDILTIAISFTASPAVARRAAAGNTRSQIMYATAAEENSAGRLPLSGNSRRKHHRWHPVGRWRYWRQTWPGSFTPLGSLSGNGLGDMSESPRWRNAEL